MVGVHPPCRQLLTQPTKSCHQQFSKLGHTQELFQRWRSFHFDEATDTTDSYVFCLKQYVQMLEYNKEQGLELLKNT